MDPRLSDDDLIQLVQEKLPEELSLAEIRLLHERLKASSELKAVLIGQLHLETYLTTALAEINVSVDEIVRRAGAMEQQKPASRWPLWTGLAGIVLALGVGMYFATRPGPEPVQIADKQDATEDDQDNPSLTKGNTKETKPVDIEPPEKVENPNPPDVPENDPPEKIAANVPLPEPRGKPTDPWFEALDPEKPLLTLEETAYRNSRWQRGEMLRKTEAQAWLKAAPGQAFRIDDKESNNNRWVELNGAGKLQAPFVEDAVLRISLFEAENFKLHFWSGDEGVTIWHYRHRRPLLWAAYKSKRKPNQPLPAELLALETSDDGRQARVRSGVLEFRYQDGSLVMSQGRTVLLSVPLPSCPKDIIFDGKCMLSEVTVYRGEPLPVSKPAPRPLAIASTSPAEAAWMTTLPGRDLREGPREIAQAREANAIWQEQLAEGIQVSAKEGHVQLAVAKSEKPTYAGTMLKRPGLYEVLFRVEDASPGTGVYFGNDQGQEIHRIGFMKDKRTGRLVFDSAAHFYTTSETERDPKNEPVPYFEPGQWIRVVWGFNAFKVWTSADGIHWGLALYPSRGLPGPFASLGLMVQRTEEPKHITLSHLEVRELSAITSLASARARKLAPSFGNLAELDFGTWNQKVLTTWPGQDQEEPQIPMDDWRRACVIRSLAESPWSSLSSTLLRGLIEEGLHQAIPIEERFRLLEEVSLLYDLWGGAEAAAMVRMYERLGAIASEEAHADPFGLVISHLHTAPIWTESNLQIISPTFAREMVLRNAYARDWDSLRSLVRRTEFLMLAAHPQQDWWWERDQRAMLDWAEILANHKSPEPSGPPEEWTRRTSRTRQWKHPLVTQVSKEGYNVMAEFEAALAGNTYDDACRIITSAGRAGLAGLLPDAKDPDLLVSLPRAIALAMREHPELQETMRQQFGEIGMVRVREAMNRADVESVEAATVRFYGTPAAAEAYEWLGDRALAGGRFAQAAQAYQEALPFADTSQIADLQNRLRLAAGLLGLDMEAEDAVHVQIGSASWTGEEFNRLIERLKSGHARAEASGLADWNTTLSSQSPPAPAHYNAVSKNQFSGEIGKGGGRNDDRNTDWAARQLAIALEGQLMFVSNRFQVVCYHLADGRTVWSKGQGDEQGETHHWPFISMQPLVIGERVIVRRLTKRGPELASLKKANGEVEWHVRPEHHVASDPVFVQGRLLALVATIPQSGMLQLDLTSFHPESGEVLSQQPVLSLNDEWSGCPPCQITASNGKILCTIGGATLCCDPLGQPQWLQQHPYIPAEVDRDSRYQHHQPPLVSEGRVYVSQSGVREAASFELATGRKLWSRPIPNIVRLAGLAGGHLVIQTEMGLEGWDEFSGELRWRHNDPDLLHGILCGDGKLLYSKRLTLGKKEQVCLVWLDPISGNEMSHAVLATLEGEQLRFGPFVKEGERLWGFFGRGYKEAQRELVELVPDKSVPPAGPLEPHALAEWADTVLPQSFSNTARVLPGWLLTTTQNFSENERGVDWLAEFRGEKSVVRTRIRNNRPVHLVRELTVKDNAPASIKLKVGHDQGRSWTAIVKFGDRELLKQVVDDASAPGGWLERDIDLSAFAGKTVWISVSQIPTDGQDPGDAFWKLLDVKDGSTAKR